MESHRRIEIVNELLEETVLMRSVLEQALEGKQVEAQQKEESQHILEDEPNPVPVFSIQEEHASWQKIFGALLEIETALLHIGQAERQRMVARFSSNA